MWRLLRSAALSVCQTLLSARARNHSSSPRSPRSSGVARCFQSPCGPNTTLYIYQHCSEANHAGRATIIFESVPVTEVVAGDNIVVKVQVGCLIIVSLVFRRTR